MKRKNLLYKSSSIRRRRALSAENATAGRRTVPGVLTSPTGLKSPYLSRRTKSKQIRDF